MVVRGHGNDLLGPLLPDDILVEFLFDLVRGGYIVDGKYRLGPVLLFALDLGLAAAAKSSSEQVSQVQKTDRRTPSVSASPGLISGLLFVIRLFMFLRLLIGIRGRRDH